MLKAIVGIGNFASFLQKVRVNGPELAAPALLLLLFLLTLSRPHRGSRVEFKEQSC